MVQIRRFSVGPLQTNCYLMGCETSLQAALIDPSWDGRAIVSAAETDGWEITHILLTHSHFDHVAGLLDAKDATGAPIYIHPDAVHMLAETPMAAAFFGIRIPAPPPPDEMLADGQILEVGEISVVVLHTPGHAPGHVSFHLPDFRVVFDGDVLFQGSIGRTDLPGGEHDTLIRSIRDRLLILPDETRLFPGHGPPTTVGEERLHNLFLQD